MSETNWQVVFDEQIWTAVDDARKEIAEYIAAGDMVHAAYCCAELRNMFDSTVFVIEASLPPDEINKANLDAAFGPEKNWQPKFKVAAAKRVRELVQVEMFRGIEKYLEEVEGGE